MARSLFLVVSEDQWLISKAQQFGMMNNIAVEVVKPSEWHGVGSSAASSSHEVPTLVSGGSSSLVSGSSAGVPGKVLAFPSPSIPTSSGTVLPASSRPNVATMNQLESVAIENAIIAFRGNLTEAARALGIGRATLYRKVKQYQIDPNVARTRRRVA